MSTLITGATGFVGLNLAQLLLAEGQSVVCLANTLLPAAARERLLRLPGSLTEVQADVRDRRCVAETLAAHRVTQVVHLAAITASAERERVAADEILSVNLAGLAAVITAAAEAGVQRFVSTGSIAVYGGQPPDGSLMHEDTPHAPQTLYALSKASGEAVLARLCGLHGMDWVLARLGRVFGPFEYDTGVRDTLSQVHQVTEAARAGRAVHLARPCIKNWSYAPDVAAGLQALLAAPALRHRVYNLGTPHAWSLADWCERLQRRHPAFRYTVGGVAPEGATEIDLGGGRDSGLLSWQRFDAEFATAPRHDLDAAFSAYQRFLNGPAQAPADLPETPDQAAA